MWRLTRISMGAALATGSFCAVFAVVIHALLPPLMGSSILIVAGISGFLGSAFAQGFRAWR